MSKVEYEKNYVYEHLIYKLAHKISDHAKTIKNDIHELHTIHANRPVYIAKANANPEDDEYRILLKVDADSAVNAHVCLKLAKQLIIADTKLIKHAQRMIKFPFKLMIFTSAKQIHKSYQIAKAENTIHSANKVPA